MLQDSITGVTHDRRLQLLLIAFCFGAFFEGAAGFGTPVAVTGAILIGLGFSPLAASGLSLIANTAPVAYGALGTPLIALAAVTGLDLLDLSAMIGRQLPLFSVIVPFWLIWAFAGWRGMIADLAGHAHCRRQSLPSRNSWSPTFTAPGWWTFVASRGLDGLPRVAFLKVLAAEESRTSTDLDAVPQRASAASGGPRVQITPRPVPHTHQRSCRSQAWLPWIILSVLMILWGRPQFKTFLDGISIVRIPVTGVHNLVQRMPPVVVKPTPEAAVYMFNWLSATGSGILVAAVVAGLLMGFSPLGLVRTIGRRSSSCASRC